MQQGENFVTLQGKVTRPKLQQVGQYNTNLFKGSLAIPTPENTYQYIKIAAWNDLAEALDNLPKDAYIKLHGHIEESSFNGKCRHCNGPDKKYWTEVIIDNFIIIEGEE